MSSVRIHLIAGARPNFMKIAPLYHELKKHEWANVKIVHSGQHYDANMSDLIFRDLKLPTPDFSLNVGSGTHGEQTGKVMIAYDKVVQSDHPDIVIVVGDVNSTIAAALVATKLGIPTAHLEAGLRSFDREMPEEINRIATDAICDILWTPSIDGNDNLIREGVTPEKISFVGNIMIDTFEMQRTAINADPIAATCGVTNGNFAIVTLHRPSNVDDPQKLAAICDLIMKVQESIQLILPLHPRTKKNVEALGLLDTLQSAPGILIIEPLPYIQFMALLTKSRFALTDSGGIQEETTYLGIPCLTLRDNTERPITVSMGTNRLVNLDTAEALINKLSAGETLSSSIPPLWDGKTAERVVSDLAKRLNIN